jgi:AcrR family transcriptional regulator
MGELRSTRADRRSRRQRDTRDALLRVAAKHFARRGIGGTRIEDITEGADVAKGAFYLHFDSKEALVAALITDAVALPRTQYLPARPAEQAEERVSSVVRAHAEFFEQHPALAALFHQARGLLETSKRGSSEIASAFGEYLRVLVQAIDVSSQLGPLGVELASVLAGAIAGYRSFRRANDAKPDYRLLAEVITPGLAGLIGRVHRAADV